MTKDCSWNYELSTYMGTTWAEHALIETKIRASDKDLPVMLETFHRVPWVIKNIVIL